MGMGAPEYIDNLRNHKDEWHKVRDAVLDLICERGKKAGYSFSVHELRMAIDGNKDDPDDMNAGTSTREDESEKGREDERRHKGPGGSTNVKGQWST